MREREREGRRTDPLPQPTNLPILLQSMPPHLPSLDPIVKLGRFKNLRPGVDERDTMGAGRVSDRRKEGEKGNEKSEGGEGEHCFGRSVSLRVSRKRGEDLMEAFFL
jgi:hypothetical protein